MNLRINAMYFSPTGTTAKVVSGLTNRIASNAGNNTLTKHIDFTLPKARVGLVSFDVEDIVIIGVPVYAGRVPNVLLKYLNSIKGNCTSAVPVVVYGNRNYDDALIELNDILESNGFNIIAAGAFIGEHAFSYALAQSRPDLKDAAIINEFADKIFLKVANKAPNRASLIPGHKPYRAYYMPKDESNKPIDFRKIMPNTDYNCIDCKLCAKICPMGSIDYYNVSQLNGICIKCGACIKKCPVQAKYIDDINYLKHRDELENEFSMRREPEVFL